MTAYVTDSSGVCWTLPKPAAWRMEYTAGVPCDSFWMRCIWDRDNAAKPESWVGFAAEHEGCRVFTGVVDECEVSVSAKGRLLEVSGRGMAALLLDNEALGQDYQVATQEDIIRDHVRPYGISTAPGDKLPAVEQFSVSTGSSEWSVVYEFARYYGGVYPRFDREGRLVLSGWRDERELILDGSVPLLALIRRDRRYGVLSQVVIRDRWSGAAETLSNQEFAAAGGRARRIITLPSRSSYKATRYSGQFQLEQSSSKWKRMEVTVGRAFWVWPGELVNVNRQGLDWNGRYRAVEVTVGMDEGGCWSRIELVDPKFTV